VAREAYTVEAHQCYRVRGRQVVFGGSQKLYSTENPHL
jgi:hypothetical protein